MTVSHPNDRTRVLARLQLERVSVSGSGLEKGPHILDPRTGEPVKGMTAAWSIAPDAARADALSTAFMVMTAEEVRDYCAAHPAVRALLVVPPDPAAGAPERILPLGLWQAGEIVA